MATIIREYKKRKNKKGWILTRRIDGHSDVKEKMKLKDLPEYHRKVLMAVEESGFFDLADGEGAANKARELSRSLSRSKEESVWVDERRKVVTIYGYNYWY